jgi:uncharacterized protein YjiS (DUF1127 family)
MRKQSQGNKAASRRRAVQAYAMHALAGNGFGDAAIFPIEQRLKSVDARPRSRTRPDGLAAILAAVHSLIQDLVRPVVAWWKRRQQASATYTALSELDARTLRDLGFDRSELSSVAAEIAGDVRSTRVRTIRRLPRRFR